MDFEFSDAAEFSGSWFYNRQGGACSYQGQKVDLPMISVCIDDPEYRLCRALQQPIVTRFCQVGLTLKLGFGNDQGDGEMAPKDKQEDYSYESRYPVLGVFCWSELLSQKLPPWALPTSHERFCLDELPENYDIERNL
jgi:hypothetical protein